MDKNNYTPHPVDTKDVILPKELKNLVEDIAKNVHEVWSAGRINDGWTYGEKRNDTEKKHPCLAPYEELSEEEKQYDRNTSIETIKLILKLGFKITRD
jgi:ryanodine receptor